MVAIDRESALRFLSALDAGGKHLFQTLDDNKTKARKSLNKTFPGTFEDNEKQLEQLNKAGAGIFVTINGTDESGSRRAENIVRVRALFVDLDGAPVEPLENCELFPSMVIESSPGHYHAYWFVDEFPIELFTICQKKLAEMFDGDKAVNDLPRIMRIPGFLHQKADPFLSHILIDWSINRYTKDQILDFLDLQPQKTVNNILRGGTQDQFLEALLDKNMVLRKEREGKIIIVCPWKDSHTDGAVEAAYFLPNYGGKSGAGFKCLHSHCADKTTEDFRFYLFPPEIIDDEGVWGEGTASEEGIGVEVVPELEGLPEDLTLTKEGAVKATLENAVNLILRNFPGVFRHDTFSNSYLLSRDVPWIYAKKGQLSETLASEMTAWLGKKFRVGWNSNMIREAIHLICSRDPYHPIRDYLDGLVWDKEERIDHFLTDAYGMEDSEYCRAVSKNWLIGAVARVYQPGAKVDTMTVFTGPQGKKKTMSFKLLFGMDWVMESVESVASKDFYQNLSGKWCVEFAELDSFRKTDYRRLKQVLTAVVDTYRPSYGHYSVDYPRQCIFVGTTNDDTFLNDPTGNRRYMPVEIRGDIDTDYISSMRDQLWAEAVSRYRDKEPWWEFPASAEDHQEKRYQYDSWESAISRWLLTIPSHTTTNDILSDCLKIEIAKHTPSDQTRVGGIMKHLKWKHVRKMISGERDYYYLRPDTE